MTMLERDKGWLLDWQEEVLEQSNTWVEEVLDRCSRYVPLSVPTGVSAHLRLAGRQNTSVSTTVT